MYRDILKSDSMKKFMVVDLGDVEFERELPDNSIFGFMEIGFNHFCCCRSSNCISGCIDTVY